MRIFERLYCQFLLLKCAFVIAWNSIIALIQLKKVKLKRALVNHYNHSTAVKILNIFKVKYHVHFEKPFIFQRNEHYIFMSNHQSLIDIPLIGASIKGPIRLIAKQEIFKIPFLGAVMQASEYIFIDRDHPQQDVFYQAKEKIKSGIWLWIFPEGTRSQTGELLPFKSGGFRLAREMGAMIIPVGIVGTKNVLPKKSFKLKLNQHVQLCIGQPIDTKEYSTIAMQKDLVCRVQQAITQLIRNNDLSRLSNMRKRYEYSSS